MLIHVIDVRCAEERISFVFFVVVVVVVESNPTGMRGEQLESAERGTKRKGATDMKGERKLRSEECQVPSSRASMSSDGLCMYTLSPAFTI